MGPRKKIKTKIRKYLKQCNNKNTAYKKILELTKQYRGKFVAKK